MWLVPMLVSYACMAYMLHKRNPTFDSRWTLMVWVVGSAFPVLNYALLLAGLANVFEDRLSAFGKWLDAPVYKNERDW